MNELIKKTAKEIARVVLAALLAALGITATGCIAYPYSTNIERFNR